MAQTQKFKGTARKIYRDEQTGSTEYWYHKTCIVQTFKDGSVRLHSGGWRTATTKNAMNQASSEFGLGFGVIQRDFEWLVAGVPFNDGMILVKSGSGGLLAVSPENVLTLPDGTVTPAFQTLEAAKAAALTM